ncbi:DEKNAAC104266 [Brettanomyces naardenensis]|uniref:Structural maintenance of chromosomes protein 5 n=1 Tax=Brettanomyces naardenensis TaxID=13370 RepID=A0A448YQC5_BRENA|nr:DEKNAAC104266 [Brettanomyces naardenensis]
MSRTASQLDLREYLPKRLKTRQKVDLSQYRAGSIIRAKLSNFMSYSLTEFHFGPKMNLIIGPNGSGKSTFVCAVCLALAGKLENLGKSSMTLDQFIKTDANSGYIELELKGAKDNETIIIDRKLVRGSKSTWNVDGRPTNESAVKKMLKDYNIQLGNLCQFLPQDRVARFASLKPEELLKEIERLYRDGELLIQHERLIELYSERKDKLKMIDEFQNRLKGLEEKHESLKEHAQKMKEYRQLEEEYKKLEKAEKYIIVTSKKERRNQLREVYIEKGRQLDEYRKQTEPWKEKLNSSDQTARETTEQIENFKEKQATYRRLVDDKMRELDGIEKEINKLQDSKEDLSTRLEARMKKLGDLAVQYERCKEAWEGISVLEEEEVGKLREERGRLQEQQQEKAEEIARIEEGRVPKARENGRFNIRIKELEKQLSSSDRLLTLDYRRYSNVIDSVKLLRREAGRLGIQYFEPPLVSIRVKDKRIAPVMERVIRNTNMTAFTVGNRPEYDKLTKFLYDDHSQVGRGVGVRTLGINSNTEPNVPRSVLKSLGFDGYLIDFIEGPKEVITMLCENENLQNTPISLAELPSDKLDKIVHEISHGGRYSFSRFVAGDSIYTFLHSSFGSRQTSTTIRPIPNFSNIFTDSISTEQKEKVKNEIEELKNQINKNKEEIEACSGELQSKKNENEVLLEKVHAVRAKLKLYARQVKTKVKYETQLSTLKDSIKLEKRNIKKLKRQGKENQMDKTLDSILMLEKSRISILAEIGPVMGKMSQLDEEIMKCEVLRIQEENKANAIEELSKSIVSSLQQLKEDKDKAKKEFTDMNVEYKEMLKKYKELLMTYSEEVKEELRKTVEDLDNRGLMTEEGIDGELGRVRSNIKLRRNRGGGYSVEMLEENERSISELKRNIEEHEGIVNGFSEEIDEILPAWKPKLESVVQTIATDFGENLRSVANAGDVQLDSESENYAEWKLRILVSFRDNEKLVQLNAAQQSGGEKSVTTAVFLNSLQGLTNTPFRIVDEINQGMDSNNERLVHKMIVNKATTVEDASQYFLITPKLLTGLYYSEQMMVHCIFAGRWCPEGENKPEFLEMGVLQKYVS